MVSAPLPLEAISTFKQGGKLLAIGRQTASGQCRAFATSSISTLFVSGGNCVDNQNNVVPCNAPASTGFAALGNFGRNSLRGPFQSNWDLSVVKLTRLTERTNLEFRTEFFNVWNHASFQSPQAAGGSLGNLGLVDVSSGDSSILATVNKPRIIQFALKLNF